MITIEEGNILDDKYTMICHQVNTLGIMGAGLAKQIKDKYQGLFVKYSDYCKSHNYNDILGDVLHYIDIITGKNIFNIFGQDRIDGSLPRTNYFCLDYGFRTIRLKQQRSSLLVNRKLAIPYGIGCGLAGGDWDNVVHPMIQNIFHKAPFNVVIVKYNGR